MVIVLLPVCKGWVTTAGTHGRVSQTVSGGGRTVGGGWTGGWVVVVGVVVAMVVMGE